MLKQIHSARTYVIARQFHLVSEYANNIKIKMDSHKRNLCDRNLLHNLATHKIKFLASSVHLTLLKFIHLIGTQKINLIHSICR